VGADSTSTFSGEAKSDRSGQVTASIAARITEVLPNGTLSVFGRRAMKVNNEVQYITVSGIVRPQDISAANRVKSTYLADSSIEYYGKGALADKQNPGWGTRILENIWPW
jgi:flagellar L-ring protein precursor FlgH